MAKINAASGVSQAGVSGTALMADGQVSVINAAMEPVYDVNRPTPDQLEVGEETFSRQLFVSTGVLSTSGVMRLTFWTARKTETTTQLRMYSGGTAAGATPTVCRIGLYTVDSTGGGTLVASIANDTALFAGATTAYTRSWSTPYAKVAGQRYALGVLVVTGATAPTFGGQTISLSAEASTAPALCSSLTAQTDLPSTFAAGSLTNSGNRPYAVILP